jgi:site-specific DNA-methyltransferase (adenine-specific)
MNRIYFGDNLPILRKMPSESVDLIYIDPPFNTGKTQKRTTIRTIRSENGDRKGFQGNHYQTIELGTKAFRDSFDSYINGFLKPRLEEAYRLLTSHGSLYFHIDYREVHYCKVLLLDEIFGRDCFLNEIIWAYDYGGRSKSRWPTKHDNILFYAKDKTKYIFNKDEIDREPYMAPGLVGPAKAKRKKLPTDTWWPEYTGVKDVTDTWWLPSVGIGQTDTWWQTIVPTNSKERIGYPTQKPRRLIDRIVKASSHPGSTVLDFFAGSGTVGESCLELERNFILIDINQEALEVMARRFSNVGNIEWVNFDPTPYQTRSDNGQTNSQESKAFPINSDFIMLAASASHLRDELQGESEETDNLWKNSPFGWVLQLSAAKKGKLARQLVYIWCQRRGLSVGYTRGSNPLMVNERQIAIKMSTLWADGKYKFQQIRDKGYDYVVCLGISPFELHCWIFEREYAIKNATPQHKSATGAEYWIAINPNKIDDWAKKCGGTLDQAYLVLKELKRK